MKTVSIALLSIVLLLVVGAGTYMYMNGSQLKQSSQSMYPTNTQNQQTVANPTSANGTTPAQKSYTMNEVASHANKNDCWLVIDGKVYDVTKFIPDHPGGNEILKGCGKDATSLFMGEREHGENNAASYLPQFQIGTIQ